MSWKLEMRCNKMDKSEIKGLISVCIVNLNKSFVESERISLDSESILFGKDSPLDSMGLLTLLMDLEEQLEEHDIFMTILDDHALSQKNSPFQSISHLTDYIYEKIQNDLK